MTDATQTCWSLLLAGVRHDDPVVRAEAARLLGEVGDARAVPGLCDMIASDRQHSKITACYALGKLGGRAAAKTLRTTAADPGVFDMPGFYNHDMIRLAAALALLWQNDGSGLDRVGDLLMEGSLEAYLHLGPAILELPDTERSRPLRARIDVPWLLKRHAARESASNHARIVQCMAHLPGKAARDYIRDSLDHVSRFVRAAAAEALLAHDRSQRSKTRIAQLFENDDTLFVRLKAAALLHEPGDKRAVRVVRRALKDDDFFIRATAVDTLAAIAEPALTSEAERALDDDEPYVRVCAAEALTAMHVAPEPGRLDGLLADASPRVRLSAARWAIAADRLIEH